MTVAGLDACPSGCPIYLDFVENQPIVKYQKGW